jgi:hypothetical protein
MPTTSEVRQALADAITDATGLRSAALVQDTMIAPIAIVSRQAFDPRMVFAQAKAPYRFRVTIYADRTNERASQVAIDEWCELAGANSVVAAIQDGDNWSVDVDYAQVTSISELQAVGVAESQFLMVELDVEVVF